MSALALAGTVVAAAAAGTALTARTTPSATPLVVSAHASPLEAVRAALAASAPVAVVGFGELHQTHATAAIPSALHRFTDEIFPALAGQFSHLVVETWMATGQCGESERAITADVAKTTERPAHTESEIETLIRRADASGVRPRILSLSCADYRSMRPPDGAVDYDRVLRITAGALLAATLRSLRDGGAGGGAPRRVAVYGGALHNDIRPLTGLEHYSFAPAVMTATLGRYVEIDLVIPEYAALDSSVRAQAWWKAWWKATLAARRGDRNATKTATTAKTTTTAKTAKTTTTTMIRRGPRSFVIVFPKQPETR